MAKDYYAVLGLDRDTTTEEIKAAYRAAVKECHPDVAGDAPELTRRFQELTEAYKVLIDPYLRKRHDQDLPMKSYPLRRPTAERVLKEVTDVIILRSDRIGPFVRALQMAKPLALEEDLLVLGFDGPNYREGAHLNISANRHALLNALKLVMGREFEFRYIQGDSSEDWERQKQADAKLAAKTRSAAPGAAPAAAETRPEGDWEELIARLHRAYDELPRRTLPQSRAALLLQAIVWINETEQKALLEGLPEDAQARGLARAIERLATLVDLPPTIVAVEVAKQKAA